jgi:hypothetical protein
LLARDIDLYHLVISTRSRAMGPCIPPNRIRYTAHITDVHEVTLFGTADFDFWQTFLRPSGLQPYRTDGGAHVVISASALAWKGFIFRELIVTVATCMDRDHAHPDSFYLAHAVNSSRIFAWAERRLFHTPYQHGDVRVDVTLPRMECRDNHGVVLQAVMAQPHALSTPSATSWSGPVFLPTPGAPEQMGKNYFCVALSGEQVVYPFVAGADVVAISSRAAHPIWQGLRESHFTPMEWRIRKQATHARSKTYRRKRAMHTPR